MKEKTEKKDRLEVLYVRPNKTAEFVEIDNDLTNRKGQAAVADSGADPVAGFLDRSPRQPYDLKSGHGLG